MITVAILLSYACVGYLTGCFVGCSHYLGLGESAPNKVTVKCGLLWPWYIAKWVLQVGNPKN